MIQEFKHWQAPKQVQQPSGQLVFVQDDDKDKSKDDWQLKATCHQCGLEGHISPDCLNKMKDEADDKNKDKKKDAKLESILKKKGMKVDFQNAQVEETKPDLIHRHEFDFGFVNPQFGETLNLCNMILLENQPTTDIFCNDKFVTDIKDTAAWTTIKTNGGTLTASKKAKIRNYGEIWFDKKAITNILSLKNVIEKGLRVTYDSDNNNSFVVNKEDGSKMYFRMHPNGLHYYDPKQQDVCMLDTVKQRSEGFSLHQVNLAKVAQEFQANVGHPSTPNLKNIIKCNMILNCPVSVTDVDQGEKIFGPSVPILKAK